MAPEGHGAQKGDPPCNFCFIKFLPKRTVEAPEAPRTPFTHPVPGGWGYRVETPQEPSPLEDHLRAKFRPDPSSRLDFYREHTDTQTDRHTDIALYVLDLSMTLKS